MTIKVIDLLNRISNGEEVPKRIKHYQTYYTWYDNGYSKGYCKEPVMTDGNSFLEINTKHDLLGEVEIIEEQQDIDIQNIDKLRIELDNNGIASNIINQLIQAVKQLDRNIKDKE